MSVSYSPCEIEQLKTTKNIIYAITNLINGKKYIGQTTRTFNQRYKGSGVGAERVSGCETNSHLASALNKYGAKNFKVDIIEVCGCAEELNEKEKYYIKYYETMDSTKGYNYCEGGGNGERQITKEAKLKKIEKSGCVTSKRTFNNYLKKMSENNVSDESIIEDILETKLFIMLDSGEVKFYKSLLSFCKTLKGKNSNIVKLHYHYKVSRGEVQQDLYETNNYAYTFYKEEDTNVPPLVEKAIKDFNNKLIKIQEKRKREEDMLNTIKRLIEKHGEWEEWEEESWHCLPITKSGWVVNEENYEDYLKDLRKEVEKNHPYYWETVFKKGKNVDISFCLGGFYKKIYK